MKEIWLPIKKYENLYQISSLGNVKSLGRVESYKNSFRERKPKILKLFKGSCQYFCVDLRNGIYRNTQMVHRLVAEAFIPNLQNKPEVNHKNGNKLDNRVENLEWVTKKENAQHALKLGLNSYKRKKGESNKLSKKVARLDEDGKIIEIFNCGKTISTKLGYHKNQIACAINSGYRCNGNYWKYIEKEIEIEEKTLLNIE